MRNLHAEAVTMQAAKQLALGDASMQRPSLRIALNIPKTSGLRIESSQDVGISDRLSHQSDEGPGVDCRVSEDISPVAIAEIPVELPEPDINSPFISRPCGLNAAKI